MPVEYLVKYDADNGYSYIEIPVIGRQFRERLCIGEGLKVESHTAGADISIDEDWLRNYVDGIVQKACDDLYNRINQLGEWSPEY